MDVLIKLLGEQWIIGAIQILLGAAIKPQLKDKLLAFGARATLLIPLINAIVAYIGFKVLPVSASAAGFVGVLIPIGQGASVAALALLQTVMITGTHSTFKNTIVPVAKVTVGWLLERVLKAIRK
jgi:hypothetical protein